MRGASLRLRLTAWYTAALVAALCLFGANVWWAQGRLGIRRVDDDLAGLTETVANLILEELGEQNTVEFGSRQAIETLAITGRAIVVLDGAGKPIAASRDAAHLGTSFLPAQSTAAGAWTAPTPAGPWRVRITRRNFAETTLGLVVGESLADVERAQHEVLEAMLVAIPIGLLLAGAGGFWLASIGLRPIAEMARQAARLPSAGMEDLGQSDRGDELGQLARAFNGLIARLRHTLETQQRFMADASHEIRTPVSVVRAAAEVALSRDQRDESEYRETLAIVGDQARRLSRLVEHMLVLARADAGGYLMRPVDLYVDEVASDCCRALGALAAERGVTIKAGGWPETLFRGDEELLRQLVLNVVQNAVQHTPSGGSVTVDLAQDAEWIRLRISDTGPGILPADRDRIFDRFVQLDDSRRGHGAGLGLPIARWIAEAHGGTLVVESSGPGGSTFCVSLPRRRD